MPIRTNPNIEAETGSKIDDSVDRDLQRRVKIHLSSQHRRALSKVNVEARDGVVTLRGRVTTFYEKQLSGQLTRRVAGVIRLIDKVVVKEIQRGLQPARAMIASPADRMLRRGNP